MDALEQLNQAAKQQKLGEDAAAAVGTARAGLILGQGLPPIRVAGVDREKALARRRGTAAFFADLALNLKPESGTCQTAATDGKRLLYNPEWWMELSAHERIGIFCHEVMHCSNDHMGRRKGRSNKRWQIACDLAINGMIREAGYSLPDGGLFPGYGEYADLEKGLSAEEYYNLLGEDGEGEEEGNGEGDGGDPGGCGAVLDSGKESPAERAKIAADWRQAVAQAVQIAKERGTLPDSIARMAEEMLTPTVPWADVLREFVRSHARDDYSWKRPNRRFVSQGLYLPSLDSEMLGEIVVSIDTSGSVDPPTLAQFGGELTGILECFPCRLTTIYHHAAVYRVDTWNPGDGPIVFDKLQSGGTDHVPVFDKIEELGLEPACMIALTDLYTAFPSNAPAFPVLWAVSGVKADAPFGQVLPLGEKR